MDELLELMARLRDPEQGCPWDVRQSFETIAPYTLEEAYEVVEAIRNRDLDALRDELGDLLLQVVFHARMAEELGAFDFNDVTRGIVEKLVRRHPHVFDGVRYADEAEQKAAWDAIKAEERAARAQPERPPSLMDEIPAAMPALMRAQKMHLRAARAGFDWPQPAQVIAKVREECNEVEAALASADQAAIAEELGDLMVAVSNLVRKCGEDAETVLQAGNRKFEHRVRAMERLAGGAAAFAELSLDEQEALWQQVKRGASSA